MNQRYASDPSHQQYLDKNPAGYCGIGGTGVNLSDPTAENWGAARQTGVARLDD